jgi:transposase
MTLHPKNRWKVPQETARVARASFPKGNVYMKMYDELGTIYCDSDFLELFPASVTVGVLTITAYQKRKTSGNNWRGK